MAGANPTIPIDYETVSEYFDYEPDTGLLRWAKKPCRRIVKGSIAGCVKSVERGYIVVGLMGRIYYAHRIIWALQTREDIPAGLVIDHRNGDTTDNRWSNLRLATHTENHRNGIHRVGVAGHRGVTWSRHKNKWQAQMSVGNKNVTIGRFDRKEDAIKARMEAEEKEFGEFSLSKSRIAS